MRSVLKAAEELAELLNATGVYDKVILQDSSAECALLTARRGDEIHFIAVSVCEDWIYAKVAHADAIPSTAWTCNNVYYTPYGLYAFAKTIEDLARKIEAKQARLKAQRRLLEEAFEKGMLG